MMSDAQINADFAFEEMERLEENKNVARQHVCIFCKTVCFFDPKSKPTTPGQVYSLAGLRELNISGVCEHCFDELFREEEERQRDTPA